MKAETGWPNTLTSELELVAKFRAESPNALAMAPVAELPMPLPQPPSRPMSELLLWVTSRNTTLMSTCGLGWSRFDRTSDM